MVIASAGQTSTQAPQSTQASRSTAAFLSTMLIASLGHSSTQDSQLLHFSSSTLAGIYVTLSKNNSKFISKRRTKCYKIKMILQHKFLENSDGKKQNRQQLCLIFTARPAPIQGRGSSVVHLNRSGAVDLPVPGLAARQRLMQLPYLARVCLSHILRSNPEPWRNCCFCFWSADK